MGYQADSLLSFDVSAISLAISALIFANSAWVISLLILFFLFRARAAAFPLPHAINNSPFGAICQRQEEEKNDAQQTTRRKKDLCSASITFLMLLSSLVV